MAAGVGAGAAVETGRAPVFIIKAGRNAHLGSAVIMGSIIMAGRAAWGHRAITQHVVLGVGIIPVRCGSA